MPNAYAFNTYVLRRKVFRLLGGAFHIYDPDGNVAFFSEQKALRLREDIRLFSDEQQTLELLSIRARQIIDFSAAYDVMDSQTGETVGTLRRRGFKSLLRDEWQITEAHGNELATIREDSLFLALFRRFAADFIPQTYLVTMGGVTVATFRQRFNPFVFKLDIDFSDDPDFRLDRRLGLAAAVLLGAVEGRQES